MKAKNKSDPEMLIGASGVTSLALLIGLGAAYIAYSSQLALAQAADSLVDVVTAVALLWAIRLSRQPPDADHPFGHQGAQPIAALILAVLAGVLSVEVLREAVSTLLSGASAEVTTELLATLGSKVLARSFFAAYAWRALRFQKAVAMGAFYIDARNDVLVGLTSVVGLALSTAFGIASLDAWLAIPVALWVGWSGLSLGIENASLLMGTVPDSARVDELHALAEAIPGVQTVPSIKARHHGLEIQLWLEIRVDPGLTVRQAHDIGEAVERRLVDEVDVCRADVHVDALMDSPK